MACLSINATNCLTAVCRCTRKWCMQLYRISMICYFSIYTCLIWILIQFYTCSDISSMDILIKDENDNLPTWYWILNLHKNPYRERYIIGSSTNSTTKKHLFITRTEILFAVKSRLQLYCDKVRYLRFNYYSHRCSNQMWIVKNYQDFLDSLNLVLFSKILFTQTFDFSKFYTTSHHTNVKTR